MYVLTFDRNQSTYNFGKEVEQVEKKINKLAKIVRATSQLALEVGTLIAIIKMIIESII